MVISLMIKCLLDTVRNRHSDNKDNNQLVGNAMEYFPIVLALYEADMEASKILEADLKK